MVVRKRQLLLAPTREKSVGGVTESYANPLPPLGILCHYIFWTLHTIYYQILVVSHLEIGGFGGHLGFKMAAMI